MNRSLLIEPDSVTPESRTKKRNPLLVPLVVCSTLALGFLIALIVVLASHSSSSPSQTPGNAAAPIAKGPSSILVFSDIHLDPLYNSSRTCSSFCRDVKLGWASGVCGPVVYQDAKFPAPYGRRACDSPLALVTLALDAAQAVNPNPSLILVAGDVAAHNLCGNPAVGFQECSTSVTLDRSSSTLAIKTVASLIQDRFPDTPVLVALGNNDTPAHYVTPLGDTDNTNLSVWDSVWTPLITCDGCSFPDGVSYSSNASTLAAGAYFWSRLSYTTAGGSVRVVVLNTLLFRNGLYENDLTAWGGVAGQEAAASTQLDWLRSVLADAEASHDKVVLMSHVSAGLDPFSTVQQLNTTWQNRLFDTLLPFNGIVTAALFGHYHLDSIALLKLGATTGGTTEVLPALLLPAFTPVYQANPTFRSFRVDNGTGDVVDYNQWWLDLPAANRAGNTKFEAAYTFSSEYGVEVSDKPGVAHVMDGLDESDAVLSRFTKHRWSSYVPFPVQVRCLATASTSEAYTACLGDQAVSERHEVCLPNYGS